MKTKTCTKCGKRKNLSEFYRRSDTKIGFRADCKQCYNISSIKIIQKQKLFDKGLKECPKCKIEKSLSEFHKNYTKKDGFQYECKECVRKYYKNYKDNNKEKLKRYNKKWYQENKQTINESLKKRRKNDVNFNILTNLRSRISMGLKGKLKSLNTMFLIGCEIDYLMHLLQEQFTEGMSWDNYGNRKGKWNIDHIKPCSLFDFSRKSEQLKCFNFKNLQPLWAIVNLRKSNKY